jgi:hypothetical protein
MKLSIMLKARKERVRTSGDQNEDILASQE